MNPIRLLLCAAVIVVAVKYPEVFARRSHSMNATTLKVGLALVALLVVFGSTRHGRTRRSRR